MPEHAAPTQVRFPWRTTIRSGVQFVVGLAPMVPVIVHSSGIPEGTVGVGGAIAISAGVTRVMALPQVESFLQRFVPWLAAKPPTDGVTYRGPVDNPVPPTRGLDSFDVPPPIPYVADPNDPTDPDDFAG